ncbi:helix-turn-helix domain-containing protein [Leptospira perolatii]|uniref:Helix-turn-helix domain-containing protein n=1 Tax=Leptospira perolatii TaxID=2023191 RepID=A0A2M9ZPK8_9LEPT|nr:helix-turn-helix domain-containing protein [Leptospira perolatii]PJZ70756.1 helix-turn-helix domain-containing protein [Leptospira perolatii]PJZ73964.1 helix-turn-helix domain-containing protein [Leptospira perolatii]
MGDHYPYIKFVSDIIESGLWAQLSAAAKTLYLVLLKFSDQNFKPVWPSTEMLLRLTGFKTKKSIIEGKRDLVKAGLLQVVPGTGHKNSMYYFCFNYPGSKIPPQGYTAGYHRGGSTEHPEVGKATPEGGQLGAPNNINITIHNTQNQKPIQKPKENKLSLDLLSQEFGTSILTEAIEIAKAQRQEANLFYIRGICRNLTAAKTDRPNFEHPGAERATGTLGGKDASWFGFLEWCRESLSKSSVDILERLQVQPDGRTLFVLDPLPESLRMIVTKYFTDKIYPSILVIFSAKPEENRIKA